jgi:NAD(P)-dependent dehydrogenase (short-subunit alcohol dehydrogenase family)
LRTAASGVRDDLSIEGMEMAEARAGTDARVVLITGATSGIGRATAKLLAARGYRVFGTSRRPAADRLDGYELLPLEVTSDESAMACIAAVAERTAGRMDVLVNNVGTGILGAAEESSAGQVARLFEVNFLGAVRMTNAALPLMRARGAGLVVTMGSTGGVASVPFAGYSCATKHALEAYSEALRLEVEPFGVHATLIAPGPVSTPAGDTAMRPDRPLEAYAPGRERATADYVRAIRGGMDPGKVAEVIARVIETPNPKPRYTVGARSWAVTFLQSVLPSWAFEAGVRRIVPNDRGKIRA